MWPDLEKLFSSSTEECNSCWCMNHRLKPEAVVTGEKAKNQLKELVLNNQAFGVIAFDNAKPVGWCGFDRRADLFGHDCTYPFEYKDKNIIWSIHCFYVKPDYRGKGISKLLIKESMKILEKYNAKEVEAYPTLPENLIENREQVENFSGNYQTFIKNGFELKEKINNFYSRLVKKLNY